MKPRPTGSDNVQLGLILCIALLAGMSCLIYELVWSRYLHLIFGVSVYAVATVLTCFMLGLAAGSWHLGRVVDRSERPVTLLVRIQLLVAAYVVVSPLLYKALAMVSIAIFRSIPDSQVLHHLIRFCLAMLVLILPTYLIGGMFPVLIRLATREATTIGSRVGAIYAVNTLGAAIGTFLTGFLLIQSVGLIGSLIIAGLLSLAGAAISRRLRISTKLAIPPANDAKPPIRISLPLLVFAISGFTSLAYEVYWTRALAFFFRDSIYDLTIVLTTYLCGIVIGSLLCSLIIRRISNASIMLAMVELLIGLFALVGLLLVGQFPYWINYLQTNTALADRFGDQFWIAGNAIRFGYAFLLMLIPTCLFGATFPLMGRLCAEQLDTIGGRMGFVTAINTIGSAMGALLAGFLFFSLFGLHNSIIATAFLNIVAGLLLAAKIRDNRVLVGLISLVAASVLVAAILPGWDKLRMSSSFLDPNQNQPLEQLLTLRYYREDAQGQTAVVELTPLSRKYLVTNRLFGQNTSEMIGLTDHRRLGLIPALLHPKPEAALVVGLGAGVTLRGLAADPSVKQIDCVELSQGVVEAARYFSSENGNINENPKVHFIVNDGRNHISTTASTYDLIVLDIFHPMSSGSSTVFSREYFRLCRQRLRTGGMVCQWLPVHQLSMSEIKSIIATFRSEFPHVSLWFGMIGDSTAAIGCIGSDSPLSIDVNAMKSRMQTPSLLGELNEVALGTPPLLLSNFILTGDDLTRLVGDAPIDTDNRPIIEFAAPKLSVQSSRQGMLNLVDFEKQMTEISPLLKSTDPDFPAPLAKAVAGKRAVLRGLSFRLAGIADQQIRSYRDALGADPENADLNAMIRLLEN